MQDGFYTVPYRTLETSIGGSSVLCGLVSSKNMRELVVVLVAVASVPAAGCSTRCRSYVRLIACIVDEAGLSTHRNIIFESVRVRK